MPHLPEKSVFVLLLAGLLGIGLSGCASYNAQAALSDSRPGTRLADRFTGMLQDHCPIPANITDTERRELRLLRAEWLVAILARYGAARIEDYSGDPQADAAMLLTRVNHSIDIVNLARDDLLHEPNMFEVYRADLIMAILGTAHASIAPTIRTVGGFVVKPNPEDGLDLLGNYFKDRLYAKAYGETCTNFMQAAATGKQREVRQMIEDHLRHQCGRLAAQTGLATQCTDPGS